MRYWTSVNHCQEANTRLPVSSWMTRNRLSPSMTHGSTLEMHESSPTTLGSCEAYDTVGSCSVATTSTCLPLLFACVFTLVTRSSNGIPAIFRPMSRFATVLARVDVCRARVGRVVRFPLWCWFLPLPFFLPFLRESTCILSSSALVPLQSFERKKNNNEDSGREETVQVCRCQCLCSVQSVTCQN